MTLDEFIGFRPNCLVCGAENILSINGTMAEMFDDLKVLSIFVFSDSINRKRFLTFSSHNMMVTGNAFADVETLNTIKYSSFVLNKETNTVQYDRDFVYKNKFTLVCGCPQGHYSYSSRAIKVSNKSCDITKGYAVMKEELHYESYKVVSDKKSTSTLIFNFEVSADPITIPYKDITTFPYDDADKFVKKIQNILLLA